MNDENGSIKIREIFTELCKKYPNFKFEAIIEMIHKHDCDVVKIDHLRQQSIGNASNNISSDYVSENSNESGIDRPFSFTSASSANSESNSPVPISKTYIPSNELSKISSQKVKLQILEDAFKRLEKHRDFLNRESFYFGEVIERRKTEADFPNIFEIETLDMLVNKRYYMPAKSMSYANDLRQPDEMNKRFKGFHGIYNSQLKTNSKSRDGQQSDLNPYQLQDQLNPTLFHSPQSNDFHFANLLKVNSAQFEPISDLAQESAGHSIYRVPQRLESKILEPTISWECPQCETKNTLILCSFCEFDYRNKL